MIISIIKWISFIPLNLFVSVVGRLLNPLVVLWADKNGKLPRYFIYFATLDNSLDGDNGWQDKKWFKGSKSRIVRYINRVRWLMRNNCNGFHLLVTGFKVKPVFVYSSKGDEKVGNRPLHNGWVLRKLKQDGKTYFQFYYVKSWSKTNCIRILLGWKIWQNPKVGENKMYSVNVNPFMGYSSVA